MNDRVDHVIELGVAHMGMDLRAVGNAGVSKAKRVDAPVEILRPVRATERKPLANRRLIDLNDRDSRRFKIDGLIPNPKRNLPARLRAGLIIAHKRRSEER